MFNVYFYLFESTVEARQGNGLGVKIDQEVLESSILFSDC